MNSKKVLLEIILEYYDEEYRSFLKVLKERRIQCPKVIRIRKKKLVQSSVMPFYIKNAKENIRQPVPKARKFMKLNPL